MKHAVFVVPGRLDTRTGGSIYNRRIVSALRARGWNIDVRELAGDFPAPSIEQAEAAAEALGTIPTSTMTVVDGMAFGALPAAMIEQAARLTLVPVVHMPLAHDAALDDNVRDARRRDEAIALSVASQVVATGGSTVAALVSYGVQPQRIAVVMPGTDPAPLAIGSCGDVIHLLCVAALSPGKGHQVLLRSLAANRHHSWRLTCAGSTTRYPGLVNDLRRLTAALNLDDRVTFTGELNDSALDAQLHRSDVFVLATLQESFGMAVAEAIARAIPVVSTVTGEIPMLVGDDGGVLVAPGDLDAFRKALNQVLDDRSFRAGAHKGAIAARARLSSWDEAADKMAAVLERAGDSAADIGSRRGERG